MFFAYFGNFSLCMHSFDHISTSSLKSHIKFEFSAAVSCKEAVILGVRHHFPRLLRK